MSFSKEYINQKRKERINQERTNSFGEIGKCVGFEDDGFSKILVQLQSNNEIVHTRWNHFEKGHFRNNKCSIRINEQAINSQGLIMTIIEYKSNNNVTVQFNGSKYIAYNIAYRDFKKGLVKDWTYPDVAGVGFLGIGEYSYNTIMHNIRPYDVWIQMLHRCYIKDLPTYKNCSVCDEWLNFQNFAEWFKENGYSIPNTKMCLDKDILIKNNTEYGPNSCLFVPNEINLLFVRNKEKRTTLPIGVSKYPKPRTKQYHVHVGRKRLKDISIYVRTPEEGFQIYKREKEAYIKYIADIYKEQIPQKVYNALCTYEVEITD